MRLSIFLAAYCSTCIVAAIPSPNIYSTTDLATRSTLYGRTFPTPRVVYADDLPKQADEQALGGYIRDHHERLPDDHIAKPAKYANWLNQVEFQYHSGYPAPNNKLGGIHRKDPIMKWGQRVAEGHKEAIGAEVLNHFRGLGPTSRSRGARFAKVSQGWQRAEDGRRYARLSYHSGAPKFKNTLDILSVSERASPSPPPSPQKHPRVEPESSHPHPEVEPSHQKHPRPSSWQKRPRLQ